MFGIGDQSHVQRKQGLFFTEFAFFCVSVRVPGSLVWGSSVKHSLASVAKLLLASHLRQWWFLYNGLEKLLLRSVCSQHSLWNYFSAEISDLSLSLLFFSHCKYFRATTSSRRMKEMDFIVLILCGGERQFSNVLPKHHLDIHVRHIFDLLLHFVHETKLMLFCRCYSLNFIRRHDNIWVFRSKKMSRQL